MAKYLTTNFSGSYTIWPAQLTGRDSATGLEMRTPGLTLRVKRLGLDDSKNPVGVVDTDNLPETTKRTAKAIKGDNWKEELEKELDSGMWSLRRVEDRPVSSDAISRMLADDNIREEPSRRPVHQGIITTQSTRTPGRKVKPAAVDEE